MRTGERGGTLRGKLPRGLVSMNPPCAVAIGNFDGVHAGHRQVLRRVIASARENELTPAVLTSTRIRLGWSHPSARRVC